MTKNHLFQFARVGLCERCFVMTIPDPKRRGEDFPPMSIDCSTMPDFRIKIDVFQNTKVRLEKFTESPVAAIFFRSTRRQG